MAGIFRTDASVVQAATLVDSGTCGANLKWYYYDDRSLVINESGAMDDYRYGGNVMWYENPYILAPWDAYRDTITSVSIGKGVTYVGDCSFLSCVSLENVWISDTVTSIGDRTFESCSNLEEVIVPDNVVTVGENVFKACTSLKTVYLSNQLTGGIGLFRGCTSLVEIDLPKSITVISENMFSGCSALKTVRYFDEHIKKVDSYAFSDCFDLEEIAFNYATNIESIGIGAFSGCDKLTNVLFAPEMGSYAYRYCDGLKSVSIPSAVTTVPSYCFDSCTNLTSVEIRGKDTVVEAASAFTGCSEGLTISVNANNTEAMTLLQNAGFNCKEMDAIVAVLGGLSTYRAVNSNHCNFYTGEACEAEGVECTGQLGQADILLGGDSSTHYANNVELNSSNYSNYGTKPTGRIQAGVTKTYFYSHLVDGFFMCCVAKAYPTMKVETNTIEIGNYADLGITVDGTPNLTYTSLTPDIATIDSTGYVTGLKEGTATIRIYAEASENYMAAVDTVTVAVTKKAEEENDSDEGGSTGTTGGNGSSINSTTGTTTGGNSNTVTGGTPTQNPSLNINQNILQSPNTPLSQTITAKSKTVTYGSKAFNLKAKTDGGGTLTYKTSNKKIVTVSKAGKVTIKGYGQATITITAAANGNYKKTTKKITIKVVPKKVTIKTVKSSSKKTLSVTWKKDKTVTGYQLQFCHVKNFKRGTYQKNFKMKKTSAKVSGIKSKVYYVRIRSYKKVGKKTYYGAWSNVKRVKVK